MDNQNELEPKVSGKSTDSDSRLFRDNLTLLRRYMPRTSFIQKTYTQFYDEIQQFRQEANNQVWYCGNFSDLWSILKLKIKSLGFSFEAQDMKLIEFSFEIGEISFLERAKDYMPTEYLKAALGVLLLKKMTKFRKKISSSRIDYRECSFMKEWLRKKQKNPYKFIYREMVWDLVKTADLDKKQILHQYLVQMISYIMKRSQKLTENNQDQIHLLCYYLQIGMKFDRAQLMLSKILVENLMIKSIAKQNGSMLIFNHLMDAPPLVIKEEVQYLRSLTL